MRRRFHFPAKAIWAAVGLSYAASAAEPGCEKNLAPSKVAAVQTRLEGLPPLALDVPTVKEGVSRFIDEARKNLPEWKKLQELEESLGHDPKNLDELRAQAEAVAEQVAAQSEAQLDAITSSQDLSDTDRRSFEAKRLLLRRAQRFVERLARVEEERRNPPPPEPEPETPPPPAESKKNPAQKKPAKKSAPAQKKPEAAEKESEKAAEQTDSAQENSGEPAEPKPSDGSAESHSSENAAGERAQKDERDPSKESAKEKGGEPNEDSSQGADESQGAEQESGAEGQGTEEGKEPGEQPSKGKSAKGEPRGKESQEGQKDSAAEEGDGPGPGESAEAKSASGEGDGDGEAQEESNAQAQSGQGQGSGAEAEADEAEGQNVAEDLSSGVEIEDEVASGGKSAGKGQSGRQSLMEKLREYLEKMGQHLSEEWKDFERKPLPPLDEPKSAPMDWAARGEEARRQMDEYSKERAERQKRWAEEDRKQRERFSELFKNRERKVASPQKAKALGNSAHEELIKSLMDQLWQRVLRTYDRSDALMQGLREYAALSEKLHLQYPHADFFAGYTARARELQQTLTPLQLHYKNLQDLGLGLLQNQGAGARTVAYLQSVLQAVAATGPLNPDEERLRDLLQALSLHQDQRDPTAEERGRAFVAQLLGPLSKRIVNAQNSDPQKSDLDWTALSEKIAAGSYSDLLLFGKLRPFMNILLNEVPKPKKQIEFRGPRMPVNDADPELDGALELENYQHFFRQGAPPKWDLLRFVAGDMLENVFRDERVRNNPKMPVPKKVTILVYDISGSMKEKKKTPARNALMAAYADHSQKEVAAGRGEHTIYSIAFDGQAHDPERVAGLSAASDYFSRVREYPPGEGGSTSITRALIKAYSMIEEHQKNGGDLQRANILIITDGEDTLDVKAVEEARSKIDPKIEIALNAITLVDGNKDLAALAQNQGSKMGKVSYQHLSSAEIESLLNHAQNLKDLDQAALSFGEKQGLGNESLVHLKRLLSAIDLEKRRDQETSGTFLHAEALRALNEGSDEGNPDADKTGADLLHAASGALSSHWSPGEKAQFLRDHFETYAKRAELSSWHEGLRNCSREARARLRDWL